MSATLDVHLVTSRSDYTPLALGILAGAADAVPGCRVRRRLHHNARALIDAVDPGRRSVALFSHYVWNSAELLRISARLAAARPACRSVHGGPSVPKWEGATEAFLRDHPHVGAAVRGEGEDAVVELLEALVSGGDPAVAGVSARGADGSIRRGPDRDPPKPVDRVASPYLSGFFDDRRWVGAIIETNRGCPYGCTFCDWGSATLQKFRTFPLERVFDEIEHIARRETETIVFADSNVGVFDRDVEITEHLVRMKERYGFPRRAVMSYAKNATRRVTTITRLLADAELLDAGRLSLQTIDRPTLIAIRRANIKTERYVELRRDFEAQGFTNSTELIVGLPGQTRASFARDLDFCFRHRTVVSAGRCVLLPNSPMNEPAYREAHGVVADDDARVVATATASAEDLDAMGALAALYTIFVDRSVLRYVLMHLAHERGVAPIAFLDRLRDDLARPGRLPLTRRLLRCFEGTNPVNQRGPRSRVVLYAWGALYREIERYLERAWGVRRDGALDALMRAQEAVMPSLRRRLPRRVRLAHDVAAYVAELDRRALDGEDSEGAPPLASLAPTTLEVSDPERLRWLLFVSAGRLPLNVYDQSFELRSALRPRRVPPRLPFAPDAWSARELRRFIGYVGRVGADRVARVRDALENR